MKPEEMLATLKKGVKVKESRIDEKTYVGAKKKRTVKSVWLTVDPRDLRTAVSALIKAHPDPHFSVCSGYDMGKTVEMLYHFTINYGQRGAETAVTFKAAIDKKSLSIDTITDMVPAAIISEREMQEMLGVKVRNIPDGRRLFLDETFPKGVYPWRKDEKGPHKLVRNVHGGK